VVQFLKERGVALSEEKTSIAAVKGKIRAILKAGGSLPQDALIRRLNPIIRGWGGYYRHVVSKQVFSDIDHAIWRMTWNWAKRRHPQKGHRWIKERYFAHQDGRDWVFTDGSVTLFQMTSIPIRRHVKIQGQANPYDPDWAAYFRRRYVRQGKPTPYLLHWLST
jgi:RNA-directed DNA polymerase